MVLKMLGLGLRVYFKDTFNAFDCLVVTFTLVDILVSNLYNSINTNALTVLRTIRILRIFKLAKTWRQLQELLQTMWKTLVDIASFSIVLFLFMFIYAILGMELFAEKAKYTPEDRLDLVNGESLP